ncbi:MAG: maleylacetoacetate isomerase [Bdellovibrionales bacterium]
MLKLYSYFRSSASYRARIALHWKALPFEYVPVHLTKEGGQQNKPEYLEINPMGHVPALIHDGFLIAETVAILQYLDDVFPAKPLFPTVPRDKAMVLQIAEVVNSGIQPLQNLKVTKALEETFGLAKSASADFTKHWIGDGMHKLEKLLERTAGSFCFGGEVTAADCFLIPQCFSARRFGVNVDQFANISFIEANAVKLEAFKKAHPENQPDYQK